MKNNISLGQHWLKNRAILDEIAALSYDKEAKLCLEIGPGLGTLTSSLLKHFDRVLAIEFDARLAANLPKSFPGKNLQVKNTDFLQFDLNNIAEPYVIAGNIPYYITSPIIEKILTASHKPEKVVLLIQKEVAERIADSKETVLSLFVKNHAEIELGPIVKKAEFTPPPKVDSQVLILYPQDAIIPEKVFKLIKIGFRAPRKKLLANLSSLKSKEQLISIFQELDISPDSRPADLHLDDWERVFQKLDM